MPILRKPENSGRVVTGPKARMRLPGLVVFIVLLLGGLFLLSTALKDHIQEPDPQAQEAHQGRFADYLRFLTSEGQTRADRAVVSLIEVERLIREEQLFDDGKHARLRVEISRTRKAYAEMSAGTHPAGFTQLMERIGRSAAR